MDLEGNAPTVELQNLYPALTQCFCIILCGYFAGRLNLISETEARGIGTFVGTFSLPSLIFMSLAQLNLNSVNWLFLLAILIAKSIIFFFVAVVTLLVGRPVNYGRAGIFAVFCTQSNDFAIGYPIVAALYKTTHPDYASYLYLMAPISLAILNPISFVLMEIGKRGREIDDALSINDSYAPPASPSLKEKLKLAGSVARSIVSNPIVLMTLLGILGNFVFGHEVPAYLGGILEVLGSAFSASALFLLGLRMVGKVHKLKGAVLVVPGIIIMVKLIALPLVTREVVNMLNAGGNASNTLDLSTYGFLYGTFPSAPTVFVFASQYAVDVDLIATAMVACTFISAPLMFVSAKMITITKADPSDYVAQFDAFTLDVSIAGIVACAWVLVTFSLAKKYRRVPHRITACLVVSQLISCLGAILWNVLDKKDGVSGHLQVAFFTVGVYSTRIWTALLSISLVFLQCRSLCFVIKLQPLFVVIGWGTPVLLALLLLVFDANGPPPYKNRNPNFVYGVFQAVVAVSLLILCFIITAGCLILHQRYKKMHRRYLSLSRDVAVDGGASGSGGGGGGDGALPTIKEGRCEDSPVADIEDLFSASGVSAPGDGDISSPDGLCPARFGCQGAGRDQCQTILQQYQEQIDDDVELIEEELGSYDPQILHHIVLLVLLLCSMFVGLALSIWTLVMEQMSGIYIELSFLDATLNFGQSLIVFAVFGLDTKEIALPLLKCWRKAWFGRNVLTLPKWHELGAETRHVCDQFVTHHLQTCKSAIAVDKRWRIKVYRDVFTGNAFVDWLIEVGLARDRVDGVNYARRLVDGKVLKHINGVYHFYDRNLLYTFV